MLPAFGRQALARVAEKLGGWRRLTGTCSASPLRRAPTWGTPVSVRCAPSGRARHRVPPGRGLSDHVPSEASITQPSPEHQSLNLCRSPLHCLSLSRQNKPPGVLLEVPPTEEFSLALLLQGHPRVGPWGHSRPLQGAVSILCRTNCALDLKFSIPVSAGRRELPGVGRAVDSDRPSRVAGMWSGASQAQRTTCVSRACLLSYVPPPFDWGVLLHVPDFLARSVSRHPVPTGNPCGKVPGRPVVNASVSPGAPQQVRRCFPHRE